MFQPQNRISIVFGLMLLSCIAGCNHAQQAKSSAAPQRAQADNDITDQFDVPDGFEVRVWADSPQLFNPTNIDIDARGRVWVAEGVNYRETVKQQHALTHPKGDRIMILEDTNGDGACDSSKVFVEETDLVCPLGVAVLGNKTIVSCSPNLIVYTDTNGDDKPDKKEILLTGFGGYDHDHGLHSAIGFLDGRWYFNCGNMGPHEVTDASGWHLHSGSSYVYGNNKNTGNRKSDDGRVWTGGIALRVDRDGKHLTPLAHNFRNSYEVALDSFGNMWQNDNDDDGNRGCRTSFVMEGANMGYFNADGTRSWQADRRPGQSTITAHWHQDDPGVMPIGDNTGAGGPTGVVVYEGGLLPDKYVGCVFDADAGRNCVWMHRPVPDGAGFRFERSQLIKAKEISPDRAATQPALQLLNWFRPSDVAVGTDGAIYIADWFDAAVGGHDMHDKLGRGRILRLAPRGDRTRPPKIDLKSDDGMIAALKNSAINVRYAAGEALCARGEAVVPRLRKLAIRDDDRRVRARALWLLARCGKDGLAIVEQALADGDEKIRMTAFRALRSVNDRILDHARQLADDPSPAVRREVAIAMRDVPFAQCRDIIVKLAEKYDGHNRSYVEAIGLACDGKQAEMYPLLVGSTDPLKWSDATAGLVWRLHPLASVSAFAARARAQSLSPEARQQAMTALAFIKDPTAAQCMEELASAGPADVRETALWWLRNRGANDWKDFDVARRYAPTTQPDPVVLKKRNADRDSVVNTNAPRSKREAAASRLASEPDGGMILLSLAADGQFPADLKDIVADAITRNPDLSVRALASKYFPRKTAGGTTLPSIKELAAMKGDAPRGRAIFFGNTASCSRCHTFDAKGKDVGPDLTAIRTKYARPELLDAILNPSANIAFGYEPWIVKTTDGEVYGGFIIADGENVVLKESSGEKRTISAGKIKSRTRQTMSVMPDNVALGLSAQEIADVAEFLLTAPVKPK